MINVKLWKVNRSGAMCCNIDCSHDPRYHFNIIGNVFHLREEQIALQIYFEEEGEVYCRDCIDKVYQKLKPILDSKLWVFK